MFVQGGGPGAYEADAKLADSLRTHLGDGYVVDYPEMPDEDEPDFDRWDEVIGEAVHGADVLVGHSLGGYMLLKHLADVDAPTAHVVCLIAAPFPGGDADWVFDGFELPDAFAAGLPGSVYLYASEDDDIVPFAHRDLYAAAIPGAHLRTTTGGHQLNDDLSAVAADIRDGLAASAPR